MNPIGFIKAFFELGMVAWWIFGVALLLLGFLLIYIGTQTLNVVEGIIGFIIDIIGFMFIFYGTKIKT